MIPTFFVSLLVLTAAGCTTTDETPLAPVPASPRIEEVANGYTRFQPMTKNPVFVDPALAALCRGASQSDVEAASKRSGPHVHTAVSIFMNDLAANAFRHSSTPYPVGSVIVKEKKGLSYRTNDESAQATTHDGVGGMVKRAKGYDAAHGDWEYFYFEKVSKIETGKIASCVQCHGGAAGKDYVFGGWAKDGPAGAAMLAPVRTVRGEGNPTTQPVKPTTRAAKAGAKADKKPSPAFEPIVDDPKLPRVLIIGDSISVGYTIPTRRLLAGKANVHRVPENGGHTGQGVQKIDGWFGTGKWDVIHFNWGLHDVRGIAGASQVSIEDYEKNLRTLVKKLQGTGAKLIWASTTPIPLDVPRQILNNEHVKQYNAVAKRIMDENNIPTDDLFEFALPRLAELQIPQNPHYTSKGYEALAQRVAASIEPALPKAKP